MKFLLAAFLISTLSATCLADTKTATFACFLKMSDEIKVEQTDLILKDDGTGGVSSVTVTNAGITCGGTAIAKFGVKEVLEVSVTTASGDVIRSKINKSEAAQLMINDGNCTCLFLK